jgi:hypothetical protein
VPERLSLALVMSALLSMGCGQQPEPPAPAASSHAGLEVSACLGAEPASLLSSNGGRALGTFVGSYQTDLDARCDTPQP